MLYLCTLSHKKFVDTKNASSYAAILVSIGVTILWLPMGKAGLERVNITRNIFPQNVSQNHRFASKFFSEQMTSKNLWHFRPFFADSVFRRSLFNKVNGSKGGQSLPNLLHFDGYKWSVTLEAKWFEKTIKMETFSAFYSFLMAILEK